MKRTTLSSTGRFLVSLIALKSEHVAAVVSASPCCRSNSTHIVWKEVPLTVTRENNNGDRAAAPITIRGSVGTSTASREGARQQQQQQQQPPAPCSVQTRSEAERECMAFLKDNLMAMDRPFRQTMGFPDGDEEATADGLDNGLVGPTITLALDAKVEYPWTDDLPRDVFLDYVLNYANLNEARTNWRPLLVEALKFNESDLWRERRHEANVTSVTTWVNTHLWTLLGRDGRPIYFKPSQTPLVFDPMSTVAFGYASCTGTSILLCNALRAVGVPARVAGTPAWYGNRTQGNHNWVEVWDSDSGGDGGGEWKFLEPSPALPNVDTLDVDPCQRWFCDPSRYPSSRVYAAKMSRNVAAAAGEGEDCDCGHFPLAWEWDCRDVPAVDRTDYYAKVCGSCGDGDGGSGSVI